MHIYDIKYVKQHFKNSEKKMKIMLKQKVEKECKLGIILMIHSHIYNKWLSQTQISARRKRLKNNLLKKQDTISFLYSFCPVLHQRRSQATHTQVLSFDKPALNAWLLSLSIIKKRGEGDKITGIEII